jgi:hypothetical protein
VQEIADAIVAEGKASADARVKASLAADGADAAVSAAEHTMAASTTAGEHKSTDETAITKAAAAAAAAAAVEFGPAGVDLSPFVLFELTLPTLRAQLGTAEEAPSAAAAAAEAARGRLAWPALVELYFENNRRAND